MNHDHDITRDQDDEPGCILCGGCGEVQCVRCPGGLEHEEPCPRCMKQEHDATVDRLRAKLVVIAHADTLSNARLLAFEALHILGMGL